MRVADIDAHERPDAVVDHGDFDGFVLVAAVAAVENGSGANSALHRRLPSLETWASYWRDWRWTVRCAGAQMMQSMLKIEVSTATRAAVHIVLPCHQGPRWHDVRFPLYATPIHELQALL